MTHWIPYTPETIGKDWVYSACGEFIPITDFSAMPSCKDPRCIIGAAKHKLGLARYDSRAGFTELQLQNLKSREHKD